VERPDELPRLIRADESKLRQVFINLIGNAIKFTETGGVALRVRSNDADEGTRWLEAEVEDTGIGIPDDEIGRIFNYFEQALSGRKSGKGTGLGLAISRDFARLMGGEITVRSRCGEGSIFHFRIPLEAVEGESEQATVKPRHVMRLSSGQRKWRVLIVDDNDTNRMLLTHMLSPLGFSLKEATDGVEALQVNANWRPHLILMDAVMPTMHGNEAIHRIRQAGGDQVKIVTISASTFEQDRKKALEAGADGFIGKPFREPELLEQIAQLLPVEYLYEEQVEAIAPCDYSVRRNIEMSSDLRQQLESAINIADFDLVLELIDRLAATDKESAETLTRLAEQFDCKSMQRMIQVPASEVQ
jgi:Amt family ammonium transporter